MKRMVEGHTILQGVSAGIGVGIVAIPALVAGLAYLLRDSVVGGEVFFEDENAPLHRQRVKIGNPIYGPRHFVPRWHVWLAVAAHLLIIPTIALFFWL